MNYKKKKHKNFEQTIKDYMHQQRRKTINKVGEAATNKSLSSSRLRFALCDLKEAT